MPRRGRRLRVRDRARPRSSTTTRRRARRAAGEVRAGARAPASRSFQLLWDDVEHDLHCADDERRYGRAERPSARRRPTSATASAPRSSSRAARRVPDGLRRARATRPTDAASRATLDPGIVVYWTGPEVVSRGDRSRGARRRRAPLRAVTSSSLWDNYPVNDFAPSTLFLGPLRGTRPASRRRRAAPGSIANAMVQAVPSKLALATVADWAARPARLRPARVVRARAARGTGRRSSRRSARAAPADVDAPGRRARARPRRSRFGVDAAVGARAARGIRMTDVVVFGATAAGVAAAVGARRGGRGRSLVEPGRHVGGMVSGGLGWTDVGDAQRARRLRAPLLRGGRRALRRPALVAAGPGAARRRRRSSRRCSTASTCGSASASCRTPRSTSTRATKATCCRRSACRSRSAASRATLYGERWAGRQPAYAARQAQLRRRSSRRSRDDGSLLPQIREPELDERGWPVDRLGEGDGGLQAYGFRVCLTDRPANRSRSRRRRGYDPAELRAAAPLSRRASRTRGARPARARPRPAAERQVRRQLDRAVLAERARRLEPRLPERRPRRRARRPRAPPALHAGASLFLAPTTTSRAHPRRARELGPLRRRVRGHRRLAASAVRPRRPAACSATYVLREPDLLDAGSAARHGRARLVQHRHPRGRAHVALPAGVRACTATRVQRR